MPIYEFLCKDCGQEFETLVLKNDEKVCCPSCGSDKAGRLMSGFAHKSEGGKMVTSGGSSCSSCSGGNCSSCH